MNGKYIAFHFTITFPYTSHATLSLDEWNKENMESEKGKKTRWYERNEERKEKRIVLFVQYLIWFDNIFTYVVCIRSFFSTLHWNVFCKLPSKASRRRINMMTTSTASQSGCIDSKREKEENRKCHAIGFTDNPAIRRTEIHRKEQNLQSGTKTKRKKIIPY